MRILFLMLIVSVVSVSAQSPLARQAFDRAGEHAQAGRYDQAIADYQQVLLLSQVENASDNFLAQIYYNIGVCELQSQQPAKAVGKFQQAISLSRRSHQQAFYVLGIAHSALKNWQAAKTAFQNSLKLKESDGEAWFDLGLALVELKNFNAASKAFHNAIKHNSVNIAGAHNNLGVIAALNNDWRAAEEKFKSALAASKGKSAEAVSNLQFSNHHKQNIQPDATSKLEFSGKTKIGQ